MNPVVSNIIITDLSPKILNPSLEHLVPKTLFPKQVSFEVKGISNAIANGIRRTISNELLVSALWFEFDDYSTDNPFCIISMIQSIFRRIPIDQKVPLNTVFELDVQNNTDVDAYVYTSSIKVVKGPKALPFNNFPLMTLGPGRWLKISKITIKSDYGYKFAGHGLASSCISLALDIQPLNSYLPLDSPDRGFSSSISNPRHYKIGFISTGMMDPHDIIIMACDNIIERISAIKKEDIETHDDLHLLKIEGETDTIGNIIMRTADDLYPNLKAVTYEIDSIMRRVVIKIRCDNDIFKLYDDVIAHVVKQYTTIKKAF